MIIFLICIFLNSTVELLASSVTVFFPRLSGKARMSKSSLIALPGVAPNDATPIAAYDNVNDITATSPLTSNLALIKLSAALTLDNSEYD
jgi:hypothetical protein